jgi:hypothetical protein
VQERRELGRLIEPVLGLGNTATSCTTVPGSSSQTTLSSSSQASSSMLASVTTCGTQPVSTCGSLLATSPRDTSAAIHWWCRTVTSCPGAGTATC